MFRCRLKLRLHDFPIEYYAGNFPLWLAPDQVRLLTIGDEASRLRYGKEIASELRAQIVRVDTDFNTNPINAKITEAEQARVHTILVIVGGDMDADAVSVRLHGKGAKPKAEVSAELLQAIKGRRS